MAAVIPRCAPFHYNFVMTKQTRISAALSAVLGPARRADVHELASAERSARRSSPHQMLSWMRTNMPTAADQVDDVLFPQPFRD